MRIARWFPPDDLVATAMARLCILREDLLLELYGAAAEQLTNLDDNTAGYRRLYFWRNSLRTLEEIKSAMNHLSSHHAFRNALALEPPVREAFEAAKRNLNKASNDYLRKFRNVVGGHIDGATMQAALNGLDPSRRSYVQTGDIKGKIHYRFAADLLSVSLEQSVRELGMVDDEALVRESLAVIKETWAILDDLIVCYTAERRLS